MGPLKMKFDLKHYKNAKNITYYPNFVIGFKENKFIFHYASWFNHVINSEK